MNLFKALTKKDFLHLAITDSLSLIFIFVYAKSVCPFMDSLPIQTLFLNFIYLEIVLVLIRFFVLSRISLDENATISHQKLYRLTTISWNVTGIVSLILFYLRYHDAGFPFPSYFKLFSAYMLLGAMLIARVEVLTYENRYQKCRPHTHFIQLESLSTIITTSTLTFSIVPFLMSFIVLSRFIFYPELTDARSAIESLFVGFSAIVVATFATSLFGKKLKKDSAQIVQHLENIEEGNFKQARLLAREDELGFISENINKMAQGLDNREKIKEAFGKFVSPIVAEEFLANVAANEGGTSKTGKRMDLTIFMSDLRNFTVLSEALDPEKITILLNDYFEMVVTIIEKHNGIIDKFIGDAVMAIFGLTDNLAQTQTRDAYLASVEILEALKAFNIEHKSELQMGIGLERGEVIAGYIGSETRLEFTVLGHHVNVAARVESQTKAPEVKDLLYTQNVADVLKTKHQIDSAFAKDASLKGIKDLMPLYQAR